MFFLGSNGMKLVCIKKDVLSCRFTGKKLSTTPPVTKEWQPGVATSHICTFGVTVDVMYRW